MYAYEPDTDQWSLLRDMANVDLESLTYSATEDCFYGLVINHGERGASAPVGFAAGATFQRDIPVNRGLTPPARQNPGSGPKKRSRPGCPPADM